MEIPVGLMFMSADTVAECLPYQNYLEEAEWTALYQKLWAIVAEHEGEPVYPEIDGNPSRMEAGDHWSRLTEAEQVALVSALEEEEAKWS